MWAKELVETLDHKLLSGQLDKDITGITYDSRQIKKDMAFVAIQGFSQDGHDYLEMARQKGASLLIGDRLDALEKLAKDLDEKTDPSLVWVPDSRLALSALAHHFYDQPSHKLSLIGVTGTNGKTSTTSLLKTIFRSAGKKVGLFGTIENTIDDEVLEAERTTPESVDLYRMLDRLHKKEADYAIMEVSSHALSLERVAHVRFTAAVFTNLTQDHLDFHQDMEDYFQAKLKLFKQMEKQESKPGEKPPYMVVNIDDPYGRRLLKESSLRAVTFGLDESADYQATAIELGLSGIDFTLKTPQGQVDISLEMTGHFMVYNCLAALAIAIEEGFETDIMKRALKETRVPGRFEPVLEGQNFAVIVDYAHSPDSLESVIKTAQEVTHNRVITVFGCGGDRDRAKRPIMGKIGVEKSNYAIVTSDNPRTEDPQAIVDDVVAGLDEGLQFEQLVDRRQAIRKAIHMAQPGDMVLITGKGHEDYQIVGTKKYPFSDMLIAREAIKERLDSDGNR